MKQEYAQAVLEDAKEILEFVIEGNQSLLKEIAFMRREMNERFDLVNAKLDAVNAKLDNVAADVVAHRADTESHPKRYEVLE